ncbi:MAG: hypothetical protein Q7S07_01705 [Candidatus Omnitrophota bacterium]|nr:hypothetical protein [Candidatus Omnitrophota bacterium]
MEISEIKNRIMEKIEEEKSRSSSRKKKMSLATLSAKMGRPKEDLLKLFNKASTGTVPDPLFTKEYSADEKLPNEKSARLSALEAENVRLKNTQEDARSKSDSLRNQIDEKDREISGLKQKLEHESAGVIKDSEQEKSLINTAMEKSLGEYRNKLGLLESENRELKILHEKALKQNEGIFLQIADKDKEASELKHKFRDELNELEKSNDHTIKKSLEEYRGKLPALEAENKKLKKLHEDALRQNDNLLMRIEEKDKETASLEKRLEEEGGRVKKIKDNDKAVEEHRAEKERAVANMEALRSKLYAAAKELKELSGRIETLEEVLKHRDKRLADSDKTYKSLEKEKNELEAKFLAAENSKNALEGRLNTMSDEIEAKERRVAEAERLFNKNTESARKEMDLQIQAAERGRKALEGKIVQLNIELEAKNKRIEETELANKDLDDLVKESAVKSQGIENAKADLDEKFKEIEVKLAEAAKARESDKASAEANAAALKSEIEALKADIRQRGKREEDLNENILNMESEIETRDKKIQADIKYCENVVREVNDLRQKIKAYRLKVK